MRTISLRKQIYAKARRLRQKGLGYTTIARTLGVAKSTVSLWCRDIPLSPAQRLALLHTPERLLFSRRGAQVNRENRQRDIARIKKDAHKEIDKLSFESFRIAGAMLYWAEGTKHDTSICNADPRMICFMIQWITRVLAIPLERLTASLHIHAGDNDLQIKRYWSDLTGIPLQNFRKSFIKPAGTGHRKHVLPYGIIKVRIAGAGTENIRHRIMGWAEKTYQLAVPHLHP